ncbi:hypothetical protein BGW36DRAFT_432919 [Talaromyces proteolyticus]|uniref:Uncharacterized protein n=1 Tax=Talaromyces proteolyticus TaxID=1131652 RepID=A0AAD4KES9_9EURO|nr:uncharacterized protein BGW36DRAFT_432919 [Talaromyces proteolyticus]KAH8689954.1 hypothetical protein BGW36DRAFT_432919 [Talaromyces proteolyticus]
MSEKSNMIGTQGGDLTQKPHGLNKRMGGLNKRIDDLKKTTDILKETMDDLEKSTDNLKEWLMITRMDELGYAARHKNSFFLADLKTDVEAIAWAQGNTEHKYRQYAAILGLEEMYGLSLSRCRSLVRTAPEKIIRIANKRSDLRHFFWYQESRYYQEKEIKEGIKDMKTICTDIITLWKYSEPRHLNDKIMAKVAEFDRLLQEYHKVRGRCDSSIKHPAASGNQVR